MLPFDLRDFINLMSLVIFGGVIVSCVFAIFAYALAINRKKRSARATEPEAEEPVEMSRPPSEVLSRSSSK